MCGAELAGPIGVLDTANSMRFARRAQLENRLERGEGPKGPRLEPRATPGACPALVRPA